MNNALVIRCHCGAHIEIAIRPDGDTLYGVENVTLVADINAFLIKHEHLKDTQEGDYADHFLGDLLHERNA